MFIRRILALFFLFIAINGNNDNECFDFTSLEAEDYMLMIECFDDLACKHGKLQDDIPYLIQPIIDNYFEMLKLDVIRCWNFTLVLPIDWKGIIEGPMCEMDRNLRMQSYKDFMLISEERMMEYSCDECKEDFCKKSSAAMRSCMNYTKQAGEDGLCPKWAYGEYDKSSVSKAKDMFG